MSIDQVQIGVMGLGTVGSGLVRLLQDRSQELGERCGFDLTVKKVLVRDPRKPRMVHVPRSLLTTDPREILDDPEITVW
ncbi:MAG: hypothetical protein M1598_08030 [Actinobacteria bacterium]|nr:hypothetical protein [Actinomycetota bacterium]